MTRLCALYGVTRAGYYAWRRRPVSRHAAQDRELERRIQRVFHQHRGAYGSPRIHRALRAMGWAVSQRRVARLMRTAGLRARVVQIYRANPRLHRFYGQHPNRLWTRVATRPNQIWVGDITYVPVVGRCAFWRSCSTSIRVACSRGCWGGRAMPTSPGRCSMRPSAAGARGPGSSSTAIAAASMPPRRSATACGDRGSEYAAQAFRDRLRALGIRRARRASARQATTHTWSRSFTP